MNTTMTTTPRIYVASLADYNNGIPHGTWIELDGGKGAEEVQEEVNEMLAASLCGMAEEWAIHDYEGFHGIKIGEFEAFDTVVALAEMLEEHGEAFAAWYDNGGTDGLEADEWEGAFNEAFEGAYDSLEDWAESFLNDTGDLYEVSEHLRNYIDFAAYARDAQMGGDIWTHEAGYRRVFVFRTN